MAQKSKYYKQDSYGAKSLLLYFFQGATKNARFVGKKGHFNLEKNSTKFHRKLFFTEKVDFQSKNKRVRRQYWYHLEWFLKQSLLNYSDLSEIHYPKMPGISLRMGRNLFWVRNYPIVIIDSFNHINSNKPTCRKGPNYKIRRHCVKWTSTLSVLAKRLQCLLY